MPKLGWSTPLTRSIQVRDCPALRTLNDARAYLLDHLPEEPQARQAWQRAAELLLAAAMAWMTSALRRGKSSLRYSCSRERLIRRRIDIPNHRPVYWTS